MGTVEERLDDRYKIIGTRRKHLRFGLGYLEWMGERGVQEAKPARAPEVLEPGLEFGANGEEIAGENMARHLAVMPAVPKAEMLEAFNELMHMSTPASGAIIDISKKQNDQIQAFVFGNGGLLALTEFTRTELVKKWKITDPQRAIHFNIPFDKGNVYTPLYRILRNFAQKTPKAFDKAFETPRASLLIVKGFIGLFTKMMENRLEYITEKDANHGELTFEALKIQYKYDLMKEQIPVELKKIEAELDAREEPVA